MMAIIVYRKATKMLQDWLYFWWTRSTFQPDLQGQFSLLYFCFSATSLDFPFSMYPIHKQGMKHMDLITRAMIHVHFHLIKNSSSRPKKSFWLYIILKESTHMSFREKIIKFKRQKPAQTCQLQWLVTRKKSVEFGGHLGFVMCAEAAPTVISTTLNGLMTFG